MTTQEASKILKEILTDVLWDCGERSEAVEMAIKALEQQPCEDCISRQAVLEGIAEWVADGYADSEADISHISSLVTHLPSVTPKEKSEYEHDHEVVKAYNDGQAYILDKIRAEIEALHDTKNYLDGRGITVLDCLKIIDKYREVSE